MMVTRGAINNNTVNGLQANSAAGGSATLTVSYSSIGGNAIGVNAVGGAQILSGGNNELAGNTTNGTFTGLAALQ